MNIYVVLCLHQPSVPCVVDRETFRGGPRPSIHQAETWRNTVKENGKTLEHKNQYGRTVR